ncbi:hypothetical protein C7T36_18260 [Rhodococcus sp. AD45-ID]|uniref:hypothetical protein n=1 Tax=unclassified Rhodococcus (in: high G+C Gram-positive bacteria) TaxID=192944 RepID=UPI0005D2D88F|nr:MULTISPECIES: hypothetical protein [unclassified Rhodococcus (in: high G+C Gram-positive bacteria)]KJF21922.1 hypothetical protein SZ00_02566 [Rhodococcus sp. AD45]PSR39623.1 hypothetical protein C7T36_18260 [Rhodococcus sp. AD45-ID]
MSQIETVRVRHDWIQAALESNGGVTGLANKLGIDKSTVSRQAKGDAEAGPRFIGAVLVHNTIKFEDAFDVTIEKVVRRTVSRPGSSLPQADRISA